MHTRLLANGGNGDVRSLVLIDREGKVVSVRVHQASGYDAFDRSALEAIARWKFARLADKPWRGSVYIVPVRFKIY